MLYVYRTVVQETVKHDEESFGGFFTRVRSLVDQLQHFHPPPHLLKKLFHGQLIVLSALRIPKNLPELVTI